MDHEPARIQYRPDSNGFLDPDQTIVNFAIREKGLTFAELIEQDPSRLCRKWRKEYEKSKTASFVSGGIGAIALVGGVFVGATPLVAAGVVVGAVSALALRYSGSGVEARNIELELIDRIHPVLNLLDQLERRGANPSHLVGIYDTIARIAFVNPQLVACNAEQLKNLFEEELRKAHVLSAFTQPPGQVGASTKLNALPAESEEDYGTEEDPGSEEEGTAIAPQSPNFENASGDFFDVAYETSSADLVFTPTLREGWSPPKGLSLKERAIAVIHWLDGANFPIGRLIHMDYVFAYGSSQSGKSTILHLVSLLETALGSKVVYVNPDGDYPAVRFHKIGGVGVDDATGHWISLTKGIEKSPADKLLGVSIWLDEMWRVAAQTATAAGVSPITNELIVTALAKGSKTGAKIRLASQNATQGSNGLKNCWELFNLSFVKVQALKISATSTAPERASGQYRVTFPGQKPEIWITPPELLVAKGRRGNPDPVRSLLAWFPELLGEEPCFDNEDGDRAIAIPTSSSFESDEDLDHKAQEETSPPVNELLGRIKTRITQRLRESRGEWISLTSLTKELFNNTEDRAKAKKIVDHAIKKGHLEKDETTNSNRTVSTMVRLKKQSSSSRN